MDDETAALLVALVRSEFLGRGRFDLQRERSSGCGRRSTTTTAAGHLRAVEVAAYPIPPVWGPTDVTGASCPSARARSRPIRSTPAAFSPTQAVSSARTKGDYEAATRGFGACACDRAASWRRSPGATSSGPCSSSGLVASSVGMRALPEEPASARARAGRERPANRAVRAGMARHATRPCTAKRAPRGPERNRPSRSAWRIDCVSGTGRRRPPQQRSGSPCSNASGAKSAASERCRACGPNRATRATLAFRGGARVRAR